MQAETNSVNSKSPRGSTGDSNDAHGSSVAPEHYLQLPKATTWCILGKGSRVEKLSWVDWLNHGRT